METKDYLNYVVHEIHRTIVATVDDEGLPVTAAIDMMDCDDNSLYFLTAKGKGFYDRLTKRQFLAFTAMKGEDTMSTVAVSIRGKVRELGYERIPFDLSRKPIERASFTFGGVEKKTEGYFITDSCIGCGSCVAVCPQGCIRQDSIPFRIEQEHCLHCGNCMTACPVGAVVRG